MSTGLIIALIVIVAVVLIVAAVLFLRARRGGQGGRSLKGRFGPEYDRAVARHDGDTKAAERELSERVQRHGSLQERPLEPAQRQQYEARWAAAQEHFVDSPQQAVSEADQLLAELAGAKGFPDGGRYEEQLAALSVHHARHVDGYRRVHRAAHAGAGGGAGMAAVGQSGTAGTEEMREAMIEARLLFEELVGQSDNKRHRPAREESAKPTDGHHAPWAITRRHAKGS
ncbi:hypothetical protein ACWD1Z_19695 [Streptomyces sp. NPDC002784]